MIHNLSENNSIKVLLVFYVDRLTSQKKENVKNCKLYICTKADNGYIFADSVHWIWQQFDVFGRGTH